MMLSERCDQLWSIGRVRRGARSDWGGRLVAQMFSFLETVRLQGKDAITELFELLASAGLSPPSLQST